MRCVRELVYLSERKLRQFQDDAGSGKWFRRITGVTATAPLGLGGLGINLAEQRSAGRPPSLDSVLKQLDRSERAPKWYEDGDIAPGDWVYFEAPMAYAIVERASVALPDAPPEGLLLFLQTSTSDQGAPRVRLLLHGSGEHLIGGGLAPERSFAGSSTTLALHVMARLADGDIGFLPDRSMDPEREHASRIRRLITYMHEHSSIVSAREASSWMAGCARVTLRAAVGDHATDVDANEKWLLIASPLHVEYSTPPDE